MPSRRSARFADALELARCRADRVDLGWLAVGVIARPVPVAPGYAIWFFLIRGSRAGAAAVSRPAVVDEAPLVAVRADGDVLAS